MSLAFFTIKRASRSRTDVRMAYHVEYDCTQGYTIQQVRSRFVHEKGAGTHLSTSRDTLAVTPTPDMRVVHSNCAKHAHIVFYGSSTRPMPLSISVHIPDEVSMCLPTSPRRGLRRSNMAFTAFSAACNNTCPGRSKHHSPCESRSGGE